MSDVQPEKEMSDHEPLPYMGARIRKGLAKMAVSTYGELAALTRSEILATKYMGHTSLTKLRNVLASRDLYFRDDSNRQSRPMSERLKDIRRRVKLESRLFWPEEVDWLLGEVDRLEKECIRWQARAEAAEHNFHSTLDRLEKVGRKDV